MIKVSQQDQIQILELNRPKVNAIDESLIKALNNELDKAESNNSIKGIILTGQDGIFSGGLDIINLYEKDKEYMKSFWDLFPNLLLRIYRYPKLIFTAISGHSPAGGTVISIMTDYRIMSKGNYVIGLNEVAVGLSMPIGIGRVFQSLLGERVAEKMTLNLIIFLKCLHFCLALTHKISKNWRIIFCFRFKIDLTRCVPLVKI